MLKGNTLRVVLSATASFLPSAVLAQAQVQLSPGLDLPAEANSTLDESGDIIVTARKRVERLQDVPVAVAALTAEQVDRHDLTSLERIAAYTPQLVAGRNTAGSAAQITLRGIGTTPTSIGIEQSVAVIVDGAYYGQGRVLDDGFFDSSRVEILKGPQALFFGKNATAGVVSITTADPTGKTEGLLRGGYEFESRQVYGEAVYSSPVTDQLAVRVAVRASKMYGGLANAVGRDVTYTTRDTATGAITVHQSPADNRDGPGGDELFGRVTLKWTPMSDFTATLKASGSRSTSDNPAWNRTVFACATGFSTITGQPCRRKYEFSQQQVPADIAANIPYVSNGDPFTRYKSYSVTGTLAYELDNVSLTSVTNYQGTNLRFLFDGDIQTASSSGVWAAEHSSWRAFSSEFRALTKFDAPVNMMVGGYYQNTRRDFAQAIILGNVENSAAADPKNRYLALYKVSDTDGETIALFGQLIWKIVPNIEFTGGVRYTHETKDSAFVQPYVNPALAVGTFTPGVGVAANQTFTNWSPEATLTWKPQTNITAYVAYKTGYKSGGFSNSGLLTPRSSIDDFTFDPEKSKGFEGGIKTTFFDRSLRLNLIGYSYKFTNLQQDFFDTVTSSFVTTNAGRSKTEGAELELAWSPPSAAGLTFRGTANYNRARYTDFIAPCYSGQTIAAGCNLPGPKQDLRGASTAVAPRWTGTLGGDYETSLGALVLGMSIDARYSSRYIGSAFNQPLSAQPKYVNLDASIRLRTVNDHWTLAFIGKNLTNRYVINGANDGALTGSGTGTATGRVADQIALSALPRTVQAQLTWRY